MRPIDADALTEHIFPMPFSDYEKGWNDALFATSENAPTIDAVPVVRCKDCAKFGLFTCSISYIENHTLQFINRPPDWYCGDWKRKEDDA